MLIISKTFLAFAKIFACKHCNKTVVQNQFVAVKSPLFARLMEGLCIKRIKNNIQHRQMIFSEFFSPLHLTEFLV